MSARRFARAAALAATLTLCLAGCPQTDPPPGDQTDNTLVAPTAADLQSLKDAGLRYAALRQTLSTADARAALIAELTGGTGVVSAGLAGDGYTIVFAFASGARAALNTIEGFGAGAPYDPQLMAAKANLAARASAASNGNAWSDNLDGAPDAKAALIAQSPGPGALRHTPTSRRVLFLSAATEDLAGADVALFDALTSTLVDHNEWERSDIITRVNLAADDYATLRFADFCQLDSYGVIVIVAHGLYLETTRRTDGDGAVVVTPPTTPADPFNFGFKPIAQSSSDATPHFFIQVAAAGPIVGEAQAVTPPANGDPFNFGFKPLHPPAQSLGIDVARETARGRLLVVAHVNPHRPVVRPYFYMRDDLWKEHLSRLPNSLVYVAAPNGYADPTYDWPAVTLDDDDDPVTPPISKESDPFNFGFKPLHTAAAVTPRSGAALVFQGSSAGSVLAWTGAVDTQTALDATRLIQLMARNSVSDREAWNSGTIARTATRPGTPRSGPPTADDPPFNFGFKPILSAATADQPYATLALHSKTENAFLYLPTWSDVAVRTPVPTGTNSVEITLAYDNADIPAPAPDTLTGAPTDTFAFTGLIPGQPVTLTARALDDAGALVAESEKQLTLRSGGNPTTVAFDADPELIPLSVSPDEAEMAVFAGWPLTITATVNAPLPPGSTVVYHWTTGTIGQFDVGTVGYFPDASTFHYLTEFETTTGSVKYDIAPESWIRSTLRLPVRTLVSCYATVTLPSGAIRQTTGDSAQITINQVGRDVTAQVRTRTTLAPGGEVIQHHAHVAFYWPKDGASKWLLQFLEKSDTPTFYSNTWMMNVTPLMVGNLAEDDEAGLLLDSFSYRPADYADPAVGAALFQDRVQGFRDTYGPYRARVTAFPSE
jgi:hypothetical protein